MSDKPPKIEYPLFVSSIIRNNSSAQDRCDKKSAGTVRMYNREKQSVTCSVTGTSSVKNLALEALKTIFAGKILI